VPTTAASRVLAVLVVIVGYAVFSLITASIAAFFIGENEKKLQHEIYRDMKALRHELHELRDEIVQLTSRAQSQDGPSMPQHSTMPMDPEPANPAGSPQQQSTTP
jgi:voltage-gated potassium channel